MGVKLRDRDPIYQCWRVAAIYRCVLRNGMGRDWALARLRDVSPDGRRDHMVDIWFLGLEQITSHQKAEHPAYQVSLLAA